jgi:putative flippase GtrA
MPKRPSKQRREVTRITEYLISGGAYFWSGYAAFFVLDKVFHSAFFWCKSISTLFGWTVNFLLQRYWVFNNPKLKKNQTEVTKRYVVITLVDFVLDFLIVYGLKRIGITPYIGQFISAGFFTGWNYLWYRFWVFPEKFAKKPSKSGRARLIAHRPHGHSAYVAKG